MTVHKIIRPSVSVYLSDWSTLELDLGLLSKMIDIKKKGATSSEQTSRTHLMIRLAVQSFSNTSLLAYGSFDQILRSLPVTGKRARDLGNEHHVKHHGVA